MTERAGREGQPAAMQAKENAERVEEAAADPEHRREGEPSAEQARETDPE